MEEDTISLPVDFEKIDDDETRRSRLTRAKEKYMKLHEEMLEKDRRELERRRRDYEAMNKKEDENSGGIFLRTKRKLRKLIDRKCEEWQESKIFK